jgi:glycyl-tRNA synthetase
MVDCKACQKRFRADHLVKELTGKDLEGNLTGMTTALQGQKCPECKKSDWTEVRTLNMMFKTEMNGINEPVYLRPETAGAIFADYKNVLDSTRVKIPFGIAQIGKAFRNEIVARNFIFRLREFEQMEIEYFIDPEMEWESLFETWLKKQEEFFTDAGVDMKRIVRFEHSKEKLSHYSRKTVDIEFVYPFGQSELCGLAHRGDFDLSQHAKFSGAELRYSDPNDNAKKYIPHVLEPSFGLDRALLAVLCSAYTEEVIKGEDGKKDDIRVVMKFPPSIAPVQIAIFPLLKNKPALVDKAKEIFNALKKDFTCEFDDNGNVGKRYRRQDEIGTPYCVTIDFDTIEKDDTVTIRDRDTMQQERIKIEDLQKYFAEKIK